MVRTQSCAIAEEVCQKAAYCNAQFGFSTAFGNSESYIRRFSANSKNSPEKSLKPFSDFQFGSRKLFFQIVMVDHGAGGGHEPTR
jgi:hypothetical protein